MKRLVPILFVACVSICCDTMGPAAQPAILDTDGDGLSDGRERDLFTDPNNSDTDGDGLSDGQEVLEFGTDPNRMDSDFDGLSDGDEVLVHGTDPLNSDTDMDGLSDSLELDEFFLSDPLNPDTDGDGFLDGEEIDLGLDLLLPNPLGVVVEVLCQDYVVVATENEVGVYSNGLVAPFFFGFLSGDLVALLAEGIEGSATGPIRANLRTLETGFAHWDGEDSLIRGTIVDVEPTLLSFRIILDNGFSFEVNLFDEVETNDWFFGDEVAIVLPRQPSNPNSSLKMLNMDRCESVLVSN